jgi:hypothetical protein
LNDSRSTSPISPLIEFYAYCAASRFTSFKLLSKTNLISLVITILKITALDLYISSESTSAKQPTPYLHSQHHQTTSHPSMLSITCGEYSPGKRPNIRLLIHPTPLRISSPNTGRRLAQFPNRIQQGRQVWHPEYIRQSETT